MPGRREAWLFIVALGAGLGRGCWGQGQMSSAVLARSRVPAAPGRLYPSPASRASARLLARCGGCLYTTAPSQNCPPWCRTGVLGGTWGGLSAAGALFLPHPFPVSNHQEILHRTDVKQEFHILGPNYPLFSPKRIASPHKAPAWLLCRVAPRDVPVRSPSCCWHWAPWRLGMMGTGPALGWVTSVPSDQGPVPSLVPCCCPLRGRRAKMGSRGRRRRLAGWAAAAGQRSPLLS